MGGGQKKWLLKAGDPLEEVTTQADLTISTAMEGKDKGKICVERQEDNTGKECTL